MSPRQDSLGSRLRALVPAPLSRPPSRRLPRPVRRLVNRVRAGVRDVLDLPSRTELGEALTRLEDVSRRLETLAATELRDLGDQVSTLEDQQIAEHEVVQKLAEEHHEIEELRQVITREGAKPAAAKTVKKPARNVGAKKPAKKKAGADPATPSKAKKKAGKKAGKKAIDAKADPKKPAKKKGKKAIDAKTDPKKPAKKKGKKNPHINVGSPKPMKERKHARTKTD